MIDEARVEAFVHKALGDLGSALTASLVVIGDKLGLYRAMARAGPVTPAELAERTGTTERCVREWLAAQAAAGYVELRCRARAATRCRPSTPWRWPTKRARPACWAASRA